MTIINSNSQSQGMINFVNVCLAVCEDLSKPLSHISNTLQQSSGRNNVKSSFDGNSGVVQCNVPTFNLIRHKFDATCNFHHFRIKAGWNNCTIHQMQIWRNTRSVPGTSGMKATLVKLWCLVLTMLRQKSHRFGLFCFALPTHFCVPECHQKRVKSSTAEKVFYRWRQGVHDHRRNHLSSGWKILENV